MAVSFGTHNFGIKESISLIQAEAAALPVVGNTDFTFGGAIPPAPIGSVGDMGILIPYDYEILSLSVCCRFIAGAGTSEFDIAINGSAIGASVTLGSSTTKTVNLSVGYSGSANDVLNFETIQAGLHSHLVIAAWIKFLIP